MELNEKILNELYSSNLTLSAFLEECSCPKSWLRPSLNLTSQEIIELVDFWKAKRANQKFTIKVGPNNCNYLIVRWSNFNFTIGELMNSDTWKSEFTKQEIKELKQHYRIAIDWDKAEIEPVEDNDED